MKVDPLSRFLAARHAGGAWHGVIAGDSYKAACGFPTTPRQPIGSRRLIDCPKCLGRPQ